MLRRAGAATGLLALVALAACNAQPAAAPLPKPAPTQVQAPSPTAVPAPVQTTRRPTPVRKPFTIAVAGDVHFEGGVRLRLDDDPATVFGDIAPVLRAADLAIVNLETAVTDRGEPVDKEFVFRAPASAFAALRAAGIDVATNANNHGMDYGPVGLQDTLAAARAAGFPLVGSGEDETVAYAPYLKTVRGWRVGVIGATQVLDTEVAEAWTATPTQAGLASAKRVERLVQAVRSAARRVDVLVVYVHWGLEGEQCASADQRYLARRLVDAGADVVVGSHSHLVQGSGYLGRAYVAYGLGNFLWYSGGKGLGSLTSVLALTVDRGRVVKAVRTPAHVKGGLITPLTGPAADRERARQESLRGCSDLARVPAGS